MTIVQEIEAMDSRLVAASLEGLRIETRLREVVGDAIEHAPAVATWASGRLAVARLDQGSRLQSSDGQLPVAQR